MMFKSNYQKYSLAFVIMGILSVSLVSAPLLVLIQSVRADWIPGWQYRKSITINAALVDVDLENFPVLIDITDSDLDSEAQPDGDDIVFTDSTDVQLSHEIEFYEAGYLVAWVNVPLLSSSEDTVLYMYYGNIAAGNQEDPTGVWDEHFMMVQHLNEVSGTHYDSTGNNNDGSPQGSMVQDAVGKVDGADIFDGSNDYVTVSHSSTLTGFTEALTVEAWIKLDDVTSRQVIANKYDTSGSQRGWFLNYEGTTNGLGFFVSQDGASYSYYYANSFTPTVDTWYHIVVVWESGQPAVFYVNGELIPTSTSSGNPATSIYNNAGAPLDIGRSTYAGRYFDGVIDEVRISNPARSAGWISACYNNQMDPLSFYTVGAEESSGAPNVFNPIPFNGATSVSISLGVLSFDIVDPNGDPMDFYVSTNPFVGGRSETGQGDGTYTVTVITLDYETTYTWYVNVTDGPSWTNMTYTFTTEPEPPPPLPPVVSDVYPPDGAVNVPVSLDELSCYVSDPNGDLMNIYVATEPNIGGGEGLNLPDTPFTVPVSGLDYETAYTWYVNVTDGDLWTNETFTFTTKPIVEWWNPDWQYRKSVTINPALVDVDLENFPVLIDVDDDDLASKAQPDGDDIVFTDNEAVPLSHEIEFYEAGYLIAWVNVPLLSSSVDTVLYMYYGNEASPNQEDPTAVWDEHFMMVQHLEETVGAHYDSTANSNDGTANGVVQDAVGKVDGADDFDGSAGYVIVPHSSTLTGFTEALTVEAWIKFDTTATRQTILCKYDTSGSQRGWFLEYHNTNGLGFFVSQTGTSYSYYYASAFTPTIGTWYHVVVVWESGQPAVFYVDGELVSATSYGNPATSIFNNVGAPLDIGRSTYAGRYFDGVIDEVRISNPARSAAWIQTCYNNQMDPSALIAVGLEETSGPTIPYVISHIPDVDVLDVSIATTVEVTFSEAMDETATEGAFSLDPGDLPGSFVWSVGDTVMTFTPASVLAYETEYTVTITADAEDQEGQTMDASYSWSFTTEPPPPPPTVISHVPDVDATDVPIATTVEVTFSEPMNELVTQGAFSLANVSDITGSFNWSPDSTVMTFTPDSTLEYFTEYTATITTGAEDQEGQTMLSEYSWSFTTAPITPPTVDSHVPDVDAVDVSITATVEVTFSEPMNELVTQGAFSLANVSDVTGSFGWSVGDTVLTFTPDSPLDYDTIYTATITTAAEDQEGQTMLSEYSWSFTTAPITPPTVDSHIPVDSAIDVSIATTIEVTFSEAMDYASTEGAFSLDPGDLPGSFVWSVGDTVMTFTPDSPLDYDTIYTATITTAAEDQEGQTMEVLYDWSFTTEEEPPAAPWYDASWLFRKQVNISSSQVAGELTDFPVLISINDEDLRDNARSDGFDILFTDSSGVNKLDHEIELYESSTGLLVAWVRVPIVSASEDTVLYMYYGNSLAEDQQNPEAVWDSHYMMVQHLDETSGTHYDSTVNNNDGSPVNGVVQDAEGKIDGANSFDGTDDYVTIPHSSDITGFTEVFTASFWIKMDSVTGRRTMLNKYNTNSQRGWYIDYDSARGTNTLGLFVSATGTSYVYWYASFSPVVDNWYHIAVVWRSGQQALFYVNGAPVTAVNYQGLVASIYNNALEPLYIGRSYTSGRYFDGVIDEVRISNPARSAEWISACYNNQMDPSAFIAVGTEEEAPPVPPTVVGHVPDVGATDVLITSTVEVTFSEPMNELATQGAFSLDSVAGSFSWSLGSTVMTFTPDSPLAYGTPYTVTITTAAEDQEGQNMEALYDWSFTTAPPAPPTVVSTVPIADEMNVSVIIAVEVTFSEPMNELATQGAFSLDSVAGSFSWSLGSTVMTFTPDSPLDHDTVYTVTITTAAEDQEGQNMEALYDWSFTTALPTPPTVIGHLPDIDEIDVIVIATVEVTFNEPMDEAATEAAFSLDSVTGTFSWNPASTVMTFTPDPKLDHDTAYTATITTAAMDQQGDYMAAPYEWSFITASYTPPIVVDVVPYEDETGVFVITTIEVAFSDSMHTDATEAAFSLDGVTGSFSWSGSWRDPNTIMIFTPDSHLAYDTLYTATVSTDAMDEDGNSLEAPYIWSFTTALPTPPTVVSHDPDISETNVFTATIEVTFSEAMDEATTEAAFSIDGVTGSFSWNDDSTVMIFTPDSPLTPETTYIVTITTAAMDQQGDYMAADYIWSFTTAENEAPVIDTFTPVSLTPAVDEGDSLLFTHTSHDPNMDPLFYSWLLSYDTYAPVEVANTLDWTFLAAYGDADLYPTRTVMLVVSDGWLVATLSWTVTINDMPDPEIEQKWVYNTDGSGSGESSPIIADLLPEYLGEEVIYVGVDTVRCINGRTGIEIWRYNDGAIGWNVQPQMEDLNNDGEYEIVVPLMYPTGILVLHADGTMYWQRNGIGGSSITSKPLLVDPDGDGYWMIFACPEDVRGYSDVNNPDNDPEVPDNMWGGYTARIWAFNYDGREIKNGLHGSAGGERNISGEYWDGDGDLEDLYYQWFGWRPCSGGFSMADTNDDDIFELYQNDRHMYYSDGSHAKGTIAWEWSNEDQQLSLKWYQPDMLVSSHAPMIVDVDKDGVLDIVAAHMRGGMAVFNATSGSEIKKDMNINLPGHYQPVVYDIDRDGNIEIILADGDHGAEDIVVFDLYEWKEDARLYVGMCKFPPTVADVTGDGIMDMIAISDTGVFVLDGSHNPAVDGTYPVIVVDTGLPYQCIYAVAQDIDADGLTEFVFTSSGYRVYAYDTPAPAPALRPRSEVQFYNERRTGVAEYVEPVFYDRTAPIVSDPSPGKYATDVSVGITELSFNIKDLQGDLMDYTVTTTIPVDSADIAGVNVGDGLITVGVTSTLEYHTKYGWKVSVTDGVHWNNKTYILITEAGTPPGSEPTQDPPLLESTGIGDYLDATSANLTATSQNLDDTDGDDVTAIHRWLRNGEPIANVIIPFDTYSLTMAKDYSGFENNAEIYGATWTSYGKVGGAYSFDGVDDHMIIRDGGAGYYNGVIYPSDLGGEGDWYELTVEMWFYINEFTPKESTRLLMKLPSYEIGFGSVGGSTRPNNILSGGVWVQNPDSGDGRVGGDPEDSKATEYSSVTYNIPLDVETWYHVALTYEDGGELILYVNGVEVDSSTGGWGGELKGPIKASSGEPLFIGWFDYFKGMIDEVKIYSRCLSGEQIYHNYNDTKDGVTGFSTLSWTETRVGETWTCESTPNDGYQDGLTALSNSVEILPGPQVPPVASNAVVMGEDTESTSRAWANEDLIAVYDYFDANDDPEVFVGSFGTQIRWYMNGTHQPAWDNSPTVPASATIAHTDWNYSVKPGDGTDLADEWVNSTLIIVNTPPIIVDYDPEYPLGQSSILLYVGESETFSFTFSELDGDEVTIEWRDGDIRVYDVTSYTFTATETGSFRIEVRITDSGYGQTTVRQRWSITVR